MEIADILGQVKSTGGDPKKIVAAVSKVVAEEGGVGAMVAKLQTSGLGDQVSSWVGAGANRHADAKKVGAALGGRHVKRVAKETGVSQTQAEHDIAAVLPAVIDRLTPDGHVPTNGGTESLSQLLAALR